MNWELASEDKYRCTYVSNVAEVGCIILVYNNRTDTSAMQFVPGVRWDNTDQKLVSIPAAVDNFTYTPSNPQLAS